MCGMDQILGIGVLKQSLLLQMEMFREKQYDESTSYRITPQK